MKKLLNTLYIATPKSYLHKDHETIVVKNGPKTLGQFPALTISNIVCFGQVSASPFVMGYCGEKGIGLAFFSDRGRFLARIQGRQTGNVLLRKEQYRWADDRNSSTDLARIFVAAKITNCRAVLLREARNHGDTASMSSSVKKLAASLRQTRQTESVDELMGIEGAAANVYFGAFTDMIRRDGLTFNGRVRRPPTDPVNALLSFAYSILANECASALQGVGLDPQAGFLHKDRPGRASLALDMLEEFRAPWADRFVLTLLNRRQVQPGDFVTEASGAVRLKDDARKDFLIAWQDRKQKEINHPYLREKISIGLLPHCQSMLLARHIRGDTEYYPPYLVK